MRVNALTIRFSRGWRIADRAAETTVGERDRVVPISFGVRLFALANEPKRMVRFPRGDHVNLDEHGAAKVVREFLAER